MPRLHPTITLLLITLGALAILGLAVMWLEGDGGQAPTEAVVVSDLPDRGPAPSDLDGMVSQPSLRTRPKAAPAPEPAANKGPRLIIVAVSDRVSGQPVPSFQVTILDHDASPPLDRLDQGVPEAFHRRQGIFKVARDPGLYDVVVMAPGYLPGTLSAVSIPAENGTALVLPLDKGPGIAGTVTDNDGLTRAGIDVYLETLSLRDPGAAAPLRTKGLTGVDGRFSFSPLPAGEYAVALLWPSNTEDRVAGIRVSKSTVEVPMVLLARHQVSFRVTNNQGQPLRQARLELRGPGRFTSAVTNGTGVAVVDDLPDGSYKITVRQAGYHDLLHELELEGGMGQEVRFLQLVSEAEG